MIVYGRTYKTRYFPSLVDSLSGSVPVDGLIAGFDRVNDQIKVEIEKGWLFKNHVYLQIRNNGKYSKSKTWKLKQAPELIKNDPTLIFYLPPLRIAGNINDINAFAGTGYNFVSFFGSKRQFNQIHSGNVDILSQIISGDNITLNEIAQTSADGAAIASAWSEDYVWALPINLDRPGKWAHIN